MKKTFVAFGVFATLTGIAQAQSSVTLYGLLDTFVGQTTTETSGVGAVGKLSQTVVNTNGEKTSRWGIRGAEDLGGGLKAVFGLEGGVLVDTGAQGTVSNQGGGLFGRTAFVGLSGGFGEVTLGRVYPAYDDLRSLTNIVNDTNFSTTAAVWGTGVRDYQNRSSNAIRYASPVVSGFSGVVSYGLGENKTTTASAEQVVALHVKYVNGPLLVGYAYQSEKQVTGGNYFGSGAGVGIPAAAVAFSSDRAYNLLAASYNFGVARVVGQYNTAKGKTSALASASDKEYQLGVSVPFGAAAVHAGISSSKSDSLGNNNRGSGFGLLGTYALSKRSNLYIGYLATKVQSANAATEVRASTLGLGIKHIF